MTITETLTVLSLVGNAMAFTWASWLGFRKLRNTERQENYTNMRAEVRELLDEYSEQRQAAHKEVADLKVEINKCREECAGHVDRIHAVEMENNTLRIYQRQDRQRIRDLERSLGYPPNPDDDDSKDAG